VIPGLGYAYTGHYGTAVSSVLVNGLLIWAAANAFCDGNGGAGGLFTILGSGFYLGNITGSAQSAVRYNEYHMERFYGQFSE
jgi:hypothetical protein